MSQTLTVPGIAPFDFAGFRWPRHVARMACGPAALRRKWDGRRCCGEYYHAPRPADAGTGRDFYLGSDGQPFTRWLWCDDVPGVRIDHRGWFCDEYGNETIRGIVVALPHGRFLAGWSMGEGMASTVDAGLYDTAEDAASAADSMAERAAEDEREHDERWCALQGAESARADAQEALTRARAQYRAARAGALANPAHRGAADRARDAVTDAIRTLRDARGEFARETAEYERGAK